MGFRRFVVAFVVAVVVFTGCKLPRVSPSTSPIPNSRVADLLNRLNDERSARRLPHLIWDSTLAAYAGAWSFTMGTASNLRNSNLNVLLGPYDYLGENVGDGSAGVSAGALHVAWMHSQDHRDNILAPGFQLVGIGIYCTGNNQIWATEEFGRPTSSGPSPFAYNGGTTLNPVAQPQDDKLTC